MEKNTLLEICQKKYKNKNVILDRLYDESLQTFVMNCFLKCDPASYGKFIMNKIVYDINNHKKYIKIVSDKKDKGDFKLFYPYKTVDIKVDKEKTETIIDPSSKSIAPIENHFECKVSFLGKKDNYQIRNIRPYQNIDGGYLLCLVDCKNNFNLEFYLIDSKDLHSEFNMTHMNGTKKQHENGSYRNMGISIIKNTDNYSKLKYLSKLDGCDFENVIEYFDKVNKEQKYKFEKTDSYKKLCLEYQTYWASFSFNLPSEFSNVCYFKHQKYTQRKIINDFISNRGDIKKLFCDIHHQITLYFELTNKIAVRNYDNIIKLSIEFFNFYVNYGETDKIMNLYLKDDKLHCDFHPHF